MRIGIDARLVSYSQAGITQYTLHLMQALADIDKEDEFISLQSYREPRILIDAPNFHRHGMLTPSHNKWEQILLRFDLARLNLNVLHSPDFIPPLYPSRLKSVITVHDLAFLRWPHFLTQDSARYYGQIDRAVRRADHIIAVSQSTKDDLIAKLGTDEQKITVIYEAADPIYEPRKREESLVHLREHYPDIPAEFILFFSTIEPRKNVPGLLRAYRRLLDDYKVTIKLVLAGARGWLFEEVYALVDELKLGANCIFLGKVPNEAQVDLYNAAACLVHPAFYEGFGLPPLEAMACGTPVIVSNVSSLPEVVGDAALLVDPNDNPALTVAMWRILMDGALREELREKGLQRAGCFSWHKAAGETLKIYRFVNNGHSG